MLVLILWLLASVSFGLGAAKVELRINNKVVVDWLLLGLMFAALTQVVPAL